MRIPRYWARQDYTGVGRNGKSQTISAWGWSVLSQTDAQAHAVARAKSALDKLAAGDHPSDYDYLERPLREEIVENISVGDEEIALITRNRYGALVLNCADVCFVDVDFPPVRGRGLVDGFLLAFSAARRRARMQAGEQSTLEKVRAWARNHPGRSFRLYRTAAGLRLLFTDRLYDPTAGETGTLLAELESDELYRRLTLKQESFRARLTAKPWRCGCSQPPNRYPRETPKTQEMFAQWLATYEAQAGGRAVCRLVEAIGEPARHEGIRTVVEVHDQYTCTQEAGELV